VKHGVAKSIEGGTVSVSARPVDSETFELVVANTGAPFRRAEGGFGLSNTRDRLELLYGARGALSIQSENRGTTVSLRIPRQAHVG
jgi:LytS/YehU family sensor histidine kinase